MASSTQKKPIIDVLNFRTTDKMLSEAASRSDGRFIVKGILQRADAKNHNGRIYPFDVLQREVKKYADTFVAENRAFGELDHPDSSVVSGRNTSHTVEKIWWEGKDVWGEIEILDTPCGNIVKNILKAKKTLGISSRGLGSVNNLSEGIDEVDDDFELIAFDFVTNPSTQGAFMRPIHESKNPKAASKSVKELNSLVYDILNNLK